MPDPAAIAGKRVIVTAAASGIGAAIADAFLEHGAHVHVCDIDEKHLTALASRPGNLSASVVDVADEADVDRLFADARRSLGGLDVLVNNAGIAGPIGRLEDTARADWSRTLDVNIMGTYLCARRAIPMLKETGAGSIVNIASTAGLQPYPLRAAYAASKWAVVGLTKTLAMELGEFGITVNAVCLGSVAGPRIEAVIERQAEVRGIEPEEVRAEFLAQSSMRRFVTREEVASLVLFLCSEAGANISGQALAVDGHTESFRT